MNNIDTQSSKTFLQLKTGAFNLQVLIDIKCLRTQWLKVAQHSNKKQSESSYEKIGKYSRGQPKFKTLAGAVWRGLDG